MDPGSATLSTISATLATGSGTCSSVSKQVTRSLDLTAPVLLNEVLATGEAARLEVTFADNTRLTLGEKAKLTLDRYVFNSAAGTVAGSLSR